MRRTASNAPAAVDVPLVAPGHARRLPLQVCRCARRAWPGATAVSEALGLAAGQCTRDHLLCLLRCLRMHACPALAQRGLLAAQCRRRLASSDCWLARRRMSRVRSDGVASLRASCIARRASAAASRAASRATAISPVAPLAAFAASAAASRLMSWAAIALRAASAAISAMRRDSSPCRRLISPICLPSSPCWRPSALCWRPSSLCWRPSSAAPL